MPRPKKTRHAVGDTGPQGPVLDLDSHVATRIVDLANRLSRSASRYYRRRNGIGVVEWRLLMIIGQVAETRANRICRETQLDKGAVSRSLAVLQRLGLVSIMEDGADTRRHNVTLTPGGRALHDELVPIALDRQSELVADLTQAEIELFIDLIDRLQAKVPEAESLFNEPPPALPAVTPLRHAAQPRQRPRRPAVAPGRRLARRRGAHEVRRD